MGNPISLRTTVGSFQYGDGNNTSFAGCELRYTTNKSNNFGLASYIATNNFNNSYGLFDLKGKVNYDSKGMFEQNLRIRTAFDDDLTSTQIRYSPFTVNIPINDKVSIYNNLNYAAKYNYENKNWSHSASDFLGVSINATKNLNISVEGQVYNLQDIKNISSKDFSANLFVTWNF